MSEPDGRPSPKTDPTIRCGQDKKAGQQRKTDREEGLASPWVCVQKVVIYHGSTDDSRRLLQFEYLIPLDNITQPEQEYSKRV